MSTHLKSDAQSAQSIRLILSDVDGVLTDGKIVFDSAGNETKAFHVRDGLGVRRWIDAGFEFGIITARTSEIVTRRAQELGITLLRQAAKDKWSAAVELMAAAGVAPEQTCFIGDDLPDLPVMTKVALAVTVADGADAVRQQAHWITRLPGGQGAVRELVERLLQAKSSCKQSSTQ